MNTRPQTEIQRTAWDNHRTVIAMPRTREGSSLEERVQVLEDEIAVRDVVTRYTYCYDSDDPDGVADLFHEDAVLVNPRGTYVGQEAIRRNYAYLVGGRKEAFHYITNAAVRVESPTLAWVTSMFHAIYTRLDGTFGASGGTYVHRLEKRDGRWRIKAKRIAKHFEHSVPPLPKGKPGPPPAPSYPETSGQMIGLEG